MHEITSNRRLLLILLVYLCAMLAFSAISDLKATAAYPHTVNIEKIVSSITLFQGNVVSWQTFSSGVANIVALVSIEDKRYVVKIDRSRKIETFPTTLERLALMHNAGIKIPATIVPPHLIDNLVVWVTEYVPGTHITNEDYSLIAPVMATMHLIKTNESTITAELDVPFFIDQCRSWKQCARLEKIWKSLDLGYLQQLPHGLIHGDCSYTNALIDDHKQLTLIGFNHLRHDYFLTDIVHALRWSTFDAEGNFNKDAFDTFITTYQKTRPLTDVELAHVHTHLKHRLIRTAFLMYYHMYARPPKSTDGAWGNPELVERVLHNPENCHLDPERMAQKVLLLEERDKRPTHA